MGLKSSTLLQEEDLEEIQNETGCKLITSFDTYLIAGEPRPPKFDVSFLIFTDLYLLFFLMVFIFATVSPDQIRRLYCRFSSLDKATKGTLRSVDARNVVTFIFLDKLNIFKLL